MTVKELMKEMEGFDPDALVVLAKDSEGNEYSPLAVAGNYTYLAEEREITSPDDETGGQSACVFWPTH